jgi:nitroreductase
LFDSREIHAETSMSNKPVGPVALEDLNDTSSPLKLLQTRRSALFKSMGGPGPDNDQIDQLLEIAVRVPDHGKLTPWRFILFQDDARDKMGDVLAARWKVLYPGHGEDTRQQQRQMFLQAPLVIGVVSSLKESHKIPAWEQELSVGAVCQNILLGATSLGFNAQWISGWFSFDETVSQKLGLGAAERMAGFIFVGTAKEMPTDRPRPDAKSLTTRWNG